jgi:hypothetical protein
MSTSVFDSHMCIYYTNESQTHQQKKLVEINAIIYITENKIEVKLMREKIKLENKSKKEEEENSYPALAPSAHKI